MIQLKACYRFFTHPYVALALRLYIAGLFIYASMYKINYMAEFAETIASYRMVPHWAVNPMAATLPWIELICGILLAAGIRSRSAVIIIGALMVVFTIGIAYNLIIGSPISCGCFHTLGDAISWKTLARDILWLCMIIHIYFFDQAFHLENRYALSVEEI